MRSPTAACIPPFGTLPEYEVAYDIAVPNEYFEQASALLP